MSLSRVTGGGYGPETLQSFVTDQLRLGGQLSRITMQHLALAGEVTAWLRPTIDLSGVDPQWGAGASVERTVQAFIRAVRHHLSLSARSAALFEDSLAVGGDPLPATLGIRVWTVGESVVYVVRPGDSIRSMRAVLRRWFGQGAVAIMTRLPVEYCRSGRMTRSALLVGVQRCTAVLVGAFDGESVVQWEGSEVNLGAAPSAQPTPPSIPRTATRRVRAPGTAR